MTFLATDENTNAAVIERLRTDPIGWLATVSPRNEPRTVPVWFYWHNEQIVVLTEPNTAKTKAIAANPRVQFHLGTDAFGGGVVIVDGKAEISDRPTKQWLAEFGDGYLDKYDEHIREYGQPIEQIAETFNTSAVITPTKLRAW